MEQKTNTKALVEVALLSAIIVIVTIASNYFSLARIIGNIVTPIVIAVIYSRNGVKFALATVFVSVILSSIIIGPIIGIAMAINCGVVGITLGYCINSKKTPRKTTLILMISIIISLLLQFILFGFLMGQYNPINFFKQQIAEWITIVDESTKQMETMLAGLGIDQLDSKYKEMNTLMTTPNIIASMTITGALMFSVFESCIIIKLFEYINRRLGGESMSTLDVSDLYVSNLVSATLIGLLSICIILINKGVTQVEFVYNLVKMTSIVIFMINGVFTLEYYFKKKAGIPKMPRLVIIVVTFLLAGTMYPIIGFVESILDFRKLDPHRLRKA